MATVLIADQYKSSLVMTAEVFKDRLPGTIICIAKTGQDCLDLAKKQPFDMIVIDFDLPDTDGVTLTKILRETYFGPIVMTAMPEKIVGQAINDELFGYHDSACWVPKPVKFDKMAQVIEMFLIDKQRLLKRYETPLGAVVPGKTARSLPKVVGNIINMSMGGALFNLKEATKLKKGETLTLKLDLAKSTKKQPKATPVAKQAGPAAKQAKAGPVSEMLIQAKVAWINKKQVGLQFDAVTEPQRLSIENLLRTSKEIAEEQD